MTVNISQHSMWDSWHPKCFLGELVFPLSFFFSRLLPLSLFLSVLPFSVDDYTVPLLLPHIVSHAVTLSKTKHRGLALLSWHTPPQFRHSIALKSRKDHTVAVALDIRIHTTFNLILFCLSAFYSNPFFCHLTWLVDLQLDCIYFSCSDSFWSLYS